MPYLVATASLVIHKILSASKDPNKEAIVMGRAIAEFTRSITKQTSAGK